MKTNRTLCALALVLPFGLLVVRSIGGQDRQTQDASTSEVPTISKIDRRLREAAAPDAVLRVLVVLKHQPQREVVERIMQAAHSRMDAAETRYTELAAQPLVSQTG